MVESNITICDPKLFEVFNYPAGCPESLFGQSRVKWALTLQVEQGAAVGGGVRRRLGDGQQEGSVSSQQAAHEAKERLLDLQLQLLLTPVDLIVVGQQELQRRLLLAGSANCGKTAERIFNIKTLSAKRKRVYIRFKYVFVWYTK